MIKAIIVIVLFSLWCHDSSGCIIQGKKGLDLYHHTTYVDSGMVDIDDDGDDSLLSQATTSTQPYYYLITNLAPKFTIKSNAFSTFRSRAPPFHLA